MSAAVTAEMTVWSLFELPTACSVNEYNFFASANVVHLGIIVFLSMDTSGLRRECTSVVFDPVNSSFSRSTIATAMSE